MRNSPHILLIEDDEDDYVIARDLLSEVFGKDLKLSWVSSGQEGLEALIEDEFDLYLVDYRLGDQDGIDIVRRGISEGCKAPIIILTGLDSREIDLEAMSAGAVDYLVKGELTATLLDKAIRYAITRQHFLQTKVAANALLREKNKKLSELYQTAHRFVENVSHEFRTPLTVIKEYASIVQDGLTGEITEEQDSYMGIVIERVEDLTIMVNDMLDISRLEAGLLGVSRKMYEVEEIIERVKPTLERRAAASEGTLEFALHCDLPNVYCDANQVGRVLINLVVNALKFAPEGGRVRVLAHLDQANSAIVFGVTDNGPGIPPAQLEAIFERFKQLGGDVRASTKGFGLGLSIVKELVHLNLGEMAVESQEGKGSTFSFTLPLFEASSVMERYFKLVEHFRSDSPWVSLISLSVELDPEESMAAEVEEFLQCNLRRSDLLLRKMPNVWLLVAATGQFEMDNVVERMTEVWTAENRNRPGAELPPLEIEVKGAWEIADERGTFMACLEQELHFARKFLAEQPERLLGYPPPANWAAGDSAGASE